MQVSRRGILRGAGTLPLLAGSSAFAAFGSQAHAQTVPAAAAADGPPVTTLRLPAEEAGRAVVAMFNTERIVARAWPASENRIAIAELTY